ncbi:glycosyltransferase [Flavobacteriales bacterium]|nr:glycosyltransferase [Flavobacteriales bacterium]
MEPTTFLFLVGFAVSIGGWMVHEIMLAVAFGRSTKRQENERVAGGVDALIPQTQGVRASVLVCVRNGKRHIIGLLKAIEKQNFEGKWEVVVVDDDSTDGTWQELESFHEIHDSSFALRTFELGNTRPGKKEALALAVQQARGAALVFTDADCLPASNAWLKRMVEPLECGQDLILGLSLPRTERGPGVLGALQAWDALRIARSYVGWAELGSPYMGVGRNMAMRAAVHPGFETHQDLASGDDDLAVQRLVSAADCRVHTLTDREAQVDSGLPQTSVRWMNQKRRHWSTAPRYARMDRLRLLFPQLLTMLWLVFGLLALTSGSQGGVLHIVLWILGIGLGSAWLTAVLIFRSIAKACQAPDHWFHYGWLQPFGTAWTWMMAMTMAIIPSRDQW